MPSLGLLVVKLLVYIGIMALGAWRWGAAMRNNRARVILGGLARFALGAIVGIPAGLMLRGTFNVSSGGVFYASFYAVRFVLWLLVLKVAFRKAPFGEVVGVAAGGAVVNMALDMALPDSLMSMFYISFC